MDPDGRQSAYLPGGGTTFNGPPPGMKYNMEEYSKTTDAIGDFVQGITENAGWLTVLIDKFYFDSKYDKAAQEFYFKALTTFLTIQLEAKNSGFYDIDKDNYYSDKEVELFANYVNNTMLLNFSDQSELGPYTVKIPLLSIKEAKLYLNSLEDEINKLKKENSETIE